MLNSLHLTTFAFHYKTAADGVVSDWTSNFGSPALMTGLHDSEEFITAVFDLGLTADVELNTPCVSTSTPRTPPTA